MSKNKGYLFHPAAVLLVIGIYFIVPGKLTAQDKTYAKYIVDTLASESMAGRGYVNEGNRKASDFIASEMKRYGLESFSDSYFQPFNLPVNTFPGKVGLQINGKVLKPGIDFIISGSSPAINGTYKIRELKSKFFESSEKLSKLKGRDYSDILVLIDKSSIPKEQLPLADSLIRTNFIKSAGFIVLSGKDRLLFSVSSAYKQKSFPVFEVLKPAVPVKPTKAEVCIEAEFNPAYQVRNVIGFIHGTELSDSFLVITAHFDHLGMMGKDVVFPGANDNASGTAMMLDLAWHFSQPGNKPRYSIAFMAFSGEETGLNGSEFYVGNPLFPLKKISFLINLDMVGTGSEGITIVNGKTFLQQFERIAKINTDNEYILKVAPRGESCNSDHCPFFRAGVPAVFIYSMGKEHREYHNIYDSADRVPFTEYDDIFRLLRDFLTSYRKDAVIHVGDNQ
ncbi:MAG: peptidase M28 [Bacteroidetes bacterium]|nr:MAG: peptidase M28 [Bacteroidota bacterium]